MYTWKQAIMCAVCLYMRLTHLSFSGCWSPVCVTGSKPSPRTGHTLTAVDKTKAILFGGNDGRKNLNDVWLFDDEGKVVSCCCCCFVYLFCCDCCCVGVVLHHTILSNVATTKGRSHFVYSGV